MGSKVKRQPYSIDQSPLYQLEAKGKLSDILEMPIKELNTLVAQNDNFDIFYLYENGKPRKVESPKYKLRKIHERLFTLLQRIATPEYLHSGIKKRSYISNARQHLQSAFALKVDISKFYPSVKRASIKQMFLEQFLCSEDVAAFLADLCSVNNDGGHGKADGHVPTGSPLSQLLAYYTHKKLFDRLEEYALSRSLIMTCYVDDVTFSGNKINGTDCEAISKIIHRSGLKPNRKKTRLYVPGKVKKITGVILKEGKEFVPNSLRKRIYEQCQLVDCGQNKPVDIQNLQKLVGMLRAAEQIEPRFTKPANQYQYNLNAAQRAKAQAERGVS